MAVELDEPSSARCREVVSFPALCGGRISTRRGGRGYRPGGDGGAGGDPGAGWHGDNSAARMRDGGCCRAGRRSSASRSLRRPGGKRPRNQGVSWVISRCAAPGWPALSDARLIISLAIGCRCRGLLSKARLRAGWRNPQVRTFHSCCGRPQAGLAVVAGIPAWSMHSVLGRSWVVHRQARFTHVVMHRLVPLPCRFPAVPSGTANLTH